MSRDTEPLVRALAAAIREVAARREAERAEVRRTIRIVDGRKDGRAA